MPDGDVDREGLLDRLRVAENRLALAEAQLALARVGKAPSWQPSHDGHAELAEGLHDLGPALDVLFHTASAPMFLVAPDSTILRANQAAAELFGRPVAELPGLRTLDLTITEDVALTEERLLHAAEGHFVLKTYERPDGTPVPALAMGWPLLDDDGQTVCLIGVAIPIEHVWRSPIVMKAILADSRHEVD
jgi:PAS domain S-box-containing protein